ncbi:MAG: HTH domain-containing protein [Cutibacterium avidum]|nr:HTH domain-containing protein [Cutibacterium avidum]
MKGTDLAGLLGVSTRTLRYDIARINGISRENID